MDYRMVTMVMSCLLVRRQPPVPVPVLLYYGPALVPVATGTGAGTVPVPVHVIKATRMYSYSTADSAQQTAPNTFTIVSGDAVWFAALLRQFLHMLNVAMLEALRRNSLGVTCVVRIQAPEAAGAVDATRHRNARGMGDCKESNTADDSVLELPRASTFCKCQSKLVYACRRAYSHVATMVATFHRFTAQRCCASNSQAHCRRYRRRLTESAGALESSCG